MTITYESSCPDCGAGIGKPHQDGCDVARCLVTGRQRLQCGDEDFPDGEHPGENCGDDIWTGEWPGTVECREYGWWVTWVDPQPGERYGAWLAAAPGDPEATPDLNRLTAECDWDRQAHRWVRRDEVTR